MQDWILNLLNSYPDLEWVNINSHLKEKYGDDSLRRIQAALNELSLGNLIEVEGNANRQLGHMANVDNSGLNKVADLDNWPMRAKITTEGKKELDRRKFQLQLIEVNNSVMTANAFTKVTGAVTLALSIVIAIVSIQTCIRDKSKAVEEAKQRGQDSIQQLETNRTVEQLTKTLQEISHSLPDTSIKKVKIEK